MDMEHRDQPGEHAQEHSSCGQLEAVIGFCNVSCEDSDWHRPPPCQVPPLRERELVKTDFSFCRCLRETWRSLQTDWNGFFSRPVRPCWNQGARLTKYPTCTLLTQLLGTFLFFTYLFLIWFDDLMEPKMSPHDRPKHLTHTTNQSKLVQVCYWNLENENSRYEHVKRGFLRQTSCYLHQFTWFPASTCVCSYVFVHVLACVINAEPFHKSIKLPE